MSIDVKGKKLLIEYYTNIEMKNNGIKIIKTFLLKNKKLKRTTKIAINK